MGVSRTCYNLNDLTNKDVYNFDRLFLIVYILIIVKLKNI